MWRMAELLATQVCHAWSTASMSRLRVLKEAEHPIRARPNKLQPTSQVTHLVLFTFASCCCMQCTLHDVAHACTQSGTQACDTDKVHTKMSAVMHSTGMAQHRREQHLSQHSTAPCLPAMTSCVITLSAGCPSTSPSVSRQPRTLATSADPPMTPELLDLSDIPATCTRGGETHIFARAFPRHCSYQPICWVSCLASRKGMQPMVGTDSGCSLHIGRQQVLQARQSPRIQHSLVTCQTRNLQNVGMPGLCHAC